MADEVLAKYNWEGSHNRRAFKNLEALNLALFGMYRYFIHYNYIITKYKMFLFLGAWKGECIPEFSEYIKSIRAQMYAARMRRFKQQQKQLANQKNLI